MKDKLVKLMIASGMLSFAGFANAQSNVTLYGELDVGAYYQSKTPKDKGKLFQLMDGGLYPSFFGLKGTEDLGGGLHAGFTLESGYLTTNGAFGNSNGGMFGRNAFVDFDGPFGTVKAGLQYSPFFLAVVHTDPQGFPNQASALIPYLNNFGITGLFTTNVVTYTTPDFGGFSGSAMFGLGGVAGNFKAGKQESFSAKYSNHGLLAEIAYLKANDNTGATAQEGRLAGASYEWGLVTIAGAFANYRMPTAAVIKNVNVYSLGLSYRATPELVMHAGVYASRDRDNSTNKSMLYGIGTQYFLSKRTSLYAQVGLVHNQGLMGMGLNSQGSDTLSGFPTGTTTAVNVGINHVF